MKKIHFVLLFVLLEALAIHYYANSTSYTKAKLITASNYVVGGIYSQLSGIYSYLHLRQENQNLNETIVSLQNELERFRQVKPDTAGTLRIEGDSMTGLREYRYLPARVINNSITHQENTFTLNRGALEGMHPDMAVIASGAIVGYVMACSDHFSVCMSVLNRHFKTSGKIKGTDFFGSVSWDGVSYEYVMLTEVAKYATLNIGDTIVTTSHSKRFPPDIMIGTVEHFTLNNATYYDIQVKLHANMAALNNVQAVEYLAAEERDMLESSVDPDSVP